MFDLCKFNDVIKSGSYLTHLERFPNRQLSGIKCNTFGCKSELYDVEIFHDSSRVYVSCENCNSYSTREIAIDSPIFNRKKGELELTKEIFNKEREFNIDLYAKYKYIKSQKRKTLLKRISVIVSTIAFALLSKYFGF